LEIQPSNWYAIPKSGQYTLQQLVLEYRCGAVEVTFVEVHLGMETQRRWSATSLVRTTPALLGWSVLMTLPTEPLLDRQGEAVPQTAWYAKPLLTCSDTLALGRGSLD
jgi:hypothetical protein